jgi:heme-degrading monooxygenase HmoA
MLMQTTQDPTKKDQEKNPLIILFRSRLTEQAGEDYKATDAELEKMVQENPGFIAAKAYTAADGERLTVVWWRDEESLAEWRNLMRHREAQEIGRQKWYQYYEVEVAQVTRSKRFERK